MTDPETDQISAKTKISMGGVITAAAKRFSDRWVLCATTEASGAERCFVCGKEGESLVVHHDHFGEFCESLFWSHLWEQSAAEDRVKDAAYQEWRRLRDLAKSLFVLDQFRLCDEELGTLTVEDFKPEAARKRAPAPTQVRKPEPAPVAPVASEISEA